MPSFPFSSSIAAGATYRPLERWQYERVPMGGVIQLLHRATAVGLVATCYAGSDTVLQRTQIPAGGTAGVTPSPFDVPPITEEVAAGDKVDLEYENTTGGAITVDGMVTYQY